MRNSGIRENKSNISILKNKNKKIYSNRQDNKAFLEDSAGNLNS